MHLLSGISFSAIRPVFAICRHCRHAGRGMLAPLFIFAFVLLLFSTPGTAYSKALSTELVRGPHSLLPYLSWFVDDKGNRGIDEISSGPLQRLFTPLSREMALRGGGPIWLRLVLVKSLDGRSASLPGKSRLIMNLGKLPPGKAMIFFSEYATPVQARGYWHSEFISSFEDLVLPEPGQMPVSIYIRMEEMPDLWFDPMVDTQAGAGGSPASLPFLLPWLLVAAAIVCVLRFAAERVYWAIWSALYIVCVVSQIAMPLPGAVQAFSVKSLPALLAPGLSLIFLAQIALCMFTKPALLRLEKTVLYAYLCLGASVALMPLVPGLTWLIRLFPLWPLLLIAMLPLTLGFLAARRPGALAYFLTCFIPLLGSLFALYGVKDPTLHPTLALGSLWGLALGALPLTCACTSWWLSKKLAANKEKQEQRLVIADPASVLPRAYVAERDRKLANPGMSVLSQYQGLPPEGPAVGKRRESMPETRNIEAVTEETSALNVLYAQLLEERLPRPDLPPKGPKKRPSQEGSIFSNRGGAETRRRCVSVAEQPLHYGSGVQPAQPESLGDSGESSFGA